MRRDEKQRTWDRLSKQRKFLRRLAEDNRGSTLCQRKHGGSGKCGAILEYVSDSLGRMRLTCVRCERFIRGLCRTCPAKVAGSQRKAVYCQRCRKLAQRSASRAYRTRDPERHRAQARAYHYRHKDAKTAYMRLWRKRNPGRQYAMKCLRQARRTA